MPLQATSGAASYDAFGGGVPVEPVYIEQIFSTYLYTGNGSTQTITNGIDLSGKGGLTWIKERGAANYHRLFDTSRGPLYTLYSDLTNASTSIANSLTSFNSNGFSLGSGAGQNADTSTYASWTFRKQPKFFDVVTWTGDGTESRVLSHNLGSTPGCIIVKRTDSTSNWFTFHRSAIENLLLNTTTAGVGGLFYIASANSTTFTLGTNTTSNATGGTYVAYLFAHNAGGFGLTGTDNVISCGSYTGSDTTSTTVTLGYEPQWVMIKRATGTTSAYTGWAMFDIMRGMPVSGNDNTLLANTSDAENPATANGAFVSPTATGFTLNVAGSNLTNTANTYIYIAIRRGPMKVPTSGTSVFAPVTQTGNTFVTTNFPVDLLIDGIRNSASGSSTTDRLRGSSTNYFNVLKTYSTSAETSGSGAGFGFDNNTGYQISGIYGGSTQTVMWNLRRAPSFFDEVCYTGTGSATTFTHNLGVVPELMIVKCRSNASTPWAVYASSEGATKGGYLNQTDEFYFNGSGFWNDTSPTSSIFTVGASSYVNGSGRTYVAYLFSTCAGVSKCTSFTGTGTLQTIDCGFTSGSRFVLIKRTDSTGDWYVWDSSRGLSSSTDPYLLLNSTAAEVTSTNWVDTTSTGFQVTAASGNNVNINGASYIVLAIA